MNLYKILKILTLAILLSPLSTYAQSQTDIQPERDGTQLNTKQLLKKRVNLTSNMYCNPRFNFCFRYPSDFFTKKNISDNDDGIFLNSPEEGVQITAYAYNAIDENIEDTWENTIEIIQKKSDTAEASVSMIANEDIIQVEYLNNGYFVYTYTQLHNDKWITIEIQVENRTGTNDDRLFKYLIESVTYTLEINNAIN